LQPATLSPHATYVPANLTRAMTLHPARPLPPMTRLPWYREPQVSAPTTNPPQSRALAQLGLRCHTPANPAISRPAFPCNLAHLAHYDPRALVLAFATM
jgi:hypothetical protein